VTPRDPAFDRLLARYWDGTLTPAEWAELNARLEADPHARRWFREVCFQAVAANEAGPPADAPSRPAERGKVSRRAAIGLGLGAAGVGAALAAHSLWNRSAPPVAAVLGAKVTWTRGQVFRTGPSGDPLAVGDVIPTGGGVSTVGPTSAAVLELADGSTLCLSADTLVTVEEAGGRVLVKQGGATADLRPSAADRPGVQVSTPLVGLSSADGADVDLSSGGRQTEVNVQRGQVAACEPDGRLTDLRDGELLTVGADARPTVRPAPILPDNYVLDFTRRLPEGWRVGTREETPAGPLLAPQLWYDPYHSTQMYQIRSHQNWVRGLVRLFPDSVVSFRYRADRTGDGQVVLVSRRPRSTFKDCGCLIWEGRFLATPPGEWQPPVSVRAADLLDNHEGPRFAPPWVAFLLIFNTYTEDLGLRVADFRVTRPGVG
jgi:ferric-dicitrate binding protein FerR (iron transport regulator)